jgi:hypothetical protein
MQTAELVTNSYTEFVSGKVSQYWYFVISIFILIHDFMNNLRLIPILSLSIQSQNFLSLGQLICG